MEEASLASLIITFILSVCWCISAADPNIHVAWCFLWSIWTAVTAMLTVIFATRQGN